MGAIMLKVSYRILDPKQDEPLISQFHTVDALIFFPGPPTTKTGPAGTAIDIPIHHRVAAYVRSHFDTVEVRVPDGPRPRIPVYAPDRTAAEQARRNCDLN